MAANKTKNKKKEQQEKVDKIKEQEENAKIYAEFVRSFEPKKKEKENTFVKSKVMYPSNGETEEPSIEQYKKRKIADNVFSRTIVENNDEFNHEERTSSEEEERKKSSTKTKEIDTFLEEIKRKQKILDKRKILKEKAELAKSEDEKKRITRKINEIEKHEMLPQYFSQNEEITNLYVGNLSPETTEEYLIRKFRKFGSISSVKIMYPRKEDEKQKYRICGFVCFHSREDAEMAKECMNGTEVLGNIIKVGWSKAIPKIMKNTKNENYNNGNSYHTPKCETAYTHDDIDSKESKNKIKIFLPVEKTTKRTIDLLAKYVTEEGYSFEESIKNNERGNEIFDFLFYPSDLFYYYKWRVYSFAQGDSYKNWRMEPFQMFENGCTYVPPSLEINKKARKAMEKEKEKIKKEKEKEMMGERIKRKLVHILNHLNKKRVSICRAMIFCIRHSKYSFDIINIICDALINMKYELLKKINLIYLLSDILYNCSNQFYSSWSYRKCIEKSLPQIMYYLRKHLKKFDSKIKTKLFVDTVVRIFQVWEIWAVYNSIFMNGLKCLLLHRKIAYTDNIEIEEENENVDESLNGVKITYFEQIRKYPLHLRKLAYVYFQKNESEIDKLCEQRGLYSNEFFKKEKKIKYLLIYDDFCYSVQLVNSTKMNQNHHLQQEESRNNSYPITNDINEEMDMEE